MNTKETRWQSRTCTHLLLREIQNCNLNNHPQETVGSHQKKKKKIHIQGQRRSPKKTVGVSKSCLELSATNWHLPRALPMTEQQWHLPSAPMKIEPHAAIAVDLQHPLREFRVE